MITLATASAHPSTGLEAARYIRKLEAEKAALTDRVEMLEMELGAAIQPMPKCFKLTPKEDRLLRLLCARPAVSKSLALTAMYDGPDDEPVDQIIAVWICKLRAKLRSHGIEIETDKVAGYFLSPDMKTRLRALIAELSGEGAS